MKKRLVVFVLAMIMLFANILPASAQLNNGGSLDIGSGAGDAIDWGTIESDYYVSMTPDIKTICVGEQFQLEVVALSESEGQLTDVEIAWSSDDSTIASVDANGIVTGVSVGRIHVNAETCGYKKTCVVTVVEKGQDELPPEDDDQTGGNDTGKPPVEDAQPEKLTIKSVILSDEQFTYNGKVQTPTVKVVDSKNNVLKENKDYTITYTSGRKNVGTYTLMVVFKGNYKNCSKITKTYDIVPKGTSISKLTASKKKITVNWKKQTKQISGYQIQCSPKKNFKTVATVTVSGKKKTKVSLSGLKAKKNYFVRIRTYKNVKVNGKTVKMYSDWSAKKKIKTK